MKLVIDIDNEKYKTISDHIKATRDVISKNGYANNDVVPIGWVAIADGTPFPQGHGRLIDADKLVDSILANRQSFYTQSEIFSAINGAPTIIESDGSNKDEVNNWICQML